jgi:hypothetical protein
MASYYTRKDSPYYWIRVKRVDGTWGQRSSGLRADEKGSIRKISQLVTEETAKEAFDEDGSSAFFNQWVPQWIGYHYTNRFSLVRCNNAWAHLSAFFKSRRVRHPGEVSYSLCHDYVRWRTSSNVENAGKRTAAWNTAVMEMRVLGAIMQESLRRGWIVANPCARLGLPKRPAAEKLVITRDEEALVFTELRKRGKPEWMEECFLVAMRQGCRLREVEIPMERIDTKAMVVTFKVKGGGLHCAPLHKDLLPLVEKARVQNRTVLVTLPAQPSPRWGKFFKLIGLDVCFHCTRVTVVTRLCEAGFSESQTMAYVGHVSELVHSLYRKMRPVAVAHLGDVL